MKVDKTLNPKAVNDHIALNQKKFQAAMIISVIHKGSYCRFPDGSHKFDPKVFWGCIKCLHEISEKEFGDHLVDEGQKIVSLQEVI